MANYNKDRLENMIKNFTETTGIEVRYERQYGNGSFLWFDTEDNDGNGMYVGVNGYVDAYNILFHMRAMHNIIKTGKA